MNRITLGALAVCVATVAGATGGARASAEGTDACALLNAADISKATGLSVASGTPGPAVPGVLGKCIWVANGGAKVIVTLADAQHMQRIVAAQEKSGGTAVSGVGQTAVGIPGSPFIGGGYIINVLDAKGGFGVGVLGEEGTRDSATAIAKLIESRRQRSP
jgi:hypothetical protein